MIDHVIHDLMELFCVLLGVDSTDDDQGAKTLQIDACHLVFVASFKCVIVPNTLQCGKQMYISGFLETDTHVEVVSGPNESLMLIDYSDEFPRVELDQRVGGLSVGEFSSFHTTGRFLAD
jgi:hypothetical protein